MSKPKIILIRNLDNELQIIIPCKQDADIERLLNAIITNFSGLILKQILIDILLVDLLIQDHKIFYVYDEFEDEIRIKAENGLGEPIIEKLYIFLKREIGEE